MRDHILNAIDRTPDRGLREQVTRAALDCAELVSRYVPEEDDRAQRAIMMTKTYLLGLATRSMVGEAAEAAFEASTQYAKGDEHAASYACLAAFCAAVTITDPNRLNLAARAASDAIGYSLGHDGARPEDIAEMKHVINAHIPDADLYER